MDSDTTHCSIEGINNNEGRHKAIKKKNPSELNRWEKCDVSPPDLRTIKQLMTWRKTKDAATDWSVVNTA